MHIQTRKAMCIEQCLYSSSCEFNPTIYHIKSSISIHSLQYLFVFFSLHLVLLVLEILMVLLVMAHLLLMLSHHLISFPLQQLKLSQLLGFNLDSLRLVQQHRLVGRRVLLHYILTCQLCLLLRILYCLIVVVELLHLFVNIIFRAEFSAQIIA